MILEFTSEDGEAWFDTEISDETWEQICSAAGDEPVEQWILRAIERLVAE